MSDYIVFILIGVYLLLFIYNKVLFTILFAAIFTGCIIDYLIKKDL